ncbi:MAG: hypothetical protein QW041_00440 [Candidatus Pacearchaeota archaeon]
MFKRGQITLFVIIAILLVGAVAIFLLFQQGIIKPSVSPEEAEKIVASEVQPVKDLMIRCVKESYFDALKKIGMQGGYCSPVPVKHNQIGNYSVPYLVEKSGERYINNILLLEGDGITIEKEIEKCTDMQKIMKCINNFKSFKDVDVKASRDIRINTKFFNGKIILTINYPLTISRGSAKTTIEEMKLEIKSGLQNVYNAVIEITNSEIKNHDFNINEFARKNLFVSIERQGALEGIYYYLKTKPQQEDEESYEFNFIVER